MPTTRKQKKTRKSRRAEIESLDIILGGNHLEREESEYGSLNRMSNSPNFNVYENNEGNCYSNPRENRSSKSAEYGNNSAGTDSSAEFNRLSGELNLRISREMDEMMNSVSVQIHRANNDAISNQVLPQIQNALKAGSESSTQRGWNIPTGRPERHPEDHPSQKVRSSSRSEPDRNRLCDEDTDNAHDMLFYLYLPLEL